MNHTVAIDVSSLNLTGAGTTTYLVELMNSIESFDRGIVFNKYDYRHFFSRDNRILRKVDTVLREIIWQQFLLPSYAKNSKVDILHVPAMISPLKCRVPVVLTIHDTYVIRSPLSFPVWQRTIANSLLPACIERADKLLAVSHFTKREILELYPRIPESKIEVTWLGVHQRFRVMGEGPKEEARTTYNLDKPFILSVSTIEPRKNLKLLINAYANIKDCIDHDLVLTGVYGWKSKDLYSMVRDFGLLDRVKFTGYVPQHILPLLYNLADLFVYPSLYEGFGLPPLEAMACGCPVITSNVASLPEVVGDAALTFNPLSVDALACSIEQLLKDSGKRNSLKTKGMDRAKQFTWERCAHATVDAYKSLC